MIGLSEGALTVQEIRRLERESSRWLDDARTRLRSDRRPTPGKHEEAVDD